MTKLYNTQGDIVKNISKFLVKCNPNIRKTLLKIIPNIVFGMLVSESVCFSDIAKKLKNKFSLVQLESVFKNQKSNDFYLEKTVKADTKYFESMYSLACFSVLFLTIVGADFSKNTKCYRFVKITTHKSIHGKKTRIMSLFNVGLTLFNRAHNSCRYIRIPFSFKLYDI